MVANSLSLNNLSLNILSLNSLSLNNISLNSLSLNSLSLTFSVMVAKSLSEQLKGRRPRLRNREDAELHVGVLFWVFSFFVLLRLLFLSIFLCTFLPQDLRGWWAWYWIPRSGPASRWPCGPGWSTTCSWCPSRLSPLRLLPRLALTWHGPPYVKVCVLIEPINKFGVKLTHLSREKSQS